MVSTMQQVGGSIGTALLSSIFASAVSSYAQGHAPGPRIQADAAVHGYTVTFWVAAGIFVAGALVVGTMMRSVRVAPEHGVEPLGDGLPA
jgi:6-phosphogluconate dehydrogenase